MEARQSDGSKQEEKSQMLPDQEKVLDEQNWTHLANILDRNFFCVQLFLIVVAGVVLFPASPLP